jgi:PAS domain S-box-containing protein
VYDAVLREANVIRQRTLRVSEGPTQATGRSPAVDRAALREEETRYGELVDHLRSGVVVYEVTAGGEDFTIRECNRAAARLEKTTPQAVIGKRVTEALPGVAESGLLNVLRRVWKTGRPERHPSSRHQDQRLSSWRESYVCRLPSGLVVAVDDDVTKNMLVEEALSRYRLLAAEARDIMLFVGVDDGAIVGANAAAEAAYGYSREELLKLRIGDLRSARTGPTIDGPMRAAGSEGVLFETEHHRRDGTTFPVEVSSRGTSMVDGRGVFVSVIRDITERRLTEETLRQNELRYETFINATDDMAFLKDDELRYVIVNEANAAFFGRSVAETIGRTDADLMPPEAAARCRLTDVDALESGATVLSQEKVGERTYETRKFPVVLAGDRVGVGGYVRDITEHKLAEEKLRASQQVLEGILNAIPVRVFWKDKDLSYLGCNAIFARDAGFADPKDIVGKDDYQMGWRDQAELYRGDDLEVIASGCSKVLMEEPQTTPGGGTITLLTSKMPLHDSTGNISGVLGTYMDITGRKSAEAEIRRQAEQLQRTVEGTVLAMSRVVETRDPYTAGHERRVAELAVAIGKEMGMTVAQLDALRLAGTIHDVGKIAVPAEILAKPGRLSGVEFSLIKQHPATGFDILGAIDFGHPVAELVLQHHERLDGSGYPRGLAGKDILPEACVLAVADVVEAMSSHRPYRAALGIEAALAEIREHAGVKYDAAVVAACVRLFKERGFEFTP